MAPLGLQSLKWEERCGKQAGYVQVSQALVVWGRVLSEGSCLLRAGGREVTSRWSLRGWVGSLLGKGILQALMCSPRLCYSRLILPFLLVPSLSR